MKLACCCTASIEYNRTSCPRTRGEDLDSACDSSYHDDDYNSHDDADGDDDYNLAALDIGSLYSSRNQNYKKHTFALRLCSRRCDK